MTNLWPALEALLPLAERPSRYINHEFGSVHKPDAAFRFCMLYPDTYELGQPNQAVRILVNVVNKVEGFAAERAYLPAAEFADVMRENNLPLFSIESCSPVAEFDALGITLPHELAATNVLEALDLAGISLHAQNRAENEPFVIGGGPCTYNPEPYAPFFDIFSIGEGEEAIPEVLQLIHKLRNKGKSRKAILQAVAKLNGFYVPTLYDVCSESEAQETGTWVKPKHEGYPTKIEKRVFEGFAKSPGWEPCVVPFTEIVQDRLNVEVLRGCARGCRFCQAGMMYRPIRERSAKNIVESVKQGLAETGYDEVSLTSLSTTDHSQINEILTQLNAEFEGTGIRVSVPSQRLDSFGVEMASLVAGKKRGGLTFAPEAGTQRLRDVINKQITEDNFFAAIKAAFAAGWRRCKLYFMIGLPTETDEDIKGIASLVQRAYDCAKQTVPERMRSQVRMGVSCALFVPKAQTPFQWEGQITPDEALRRVSLLRRSVKYKAIDVHYHDPKTSTIEAALSRGGRQVASVVEAAWRAGARFDAWSEHFNQQAWDEAQQQTGVSLPAIAQQSFSSEYVMPFSHISTGVSTKFLALERKRAAQGITTPDCTFNKCTGCGACMNLGTKNELAAARKTASSSPTAKTPESAGDTQ